MGKGSRKKRKILRLAKIVNDVKVQDDAMDEEKDIKEQEENDIKKESIEDPPLEPITDIVVQKTPRIPKPIKNVGSDILAYKVVSFICLQNPPAIWSPETLKGRSGTVMNNMSVMLTLQIPFDMASIYKIEQGKGICAPHELQPRVKYCTNMARCINAEFMGEPKEVCQALEAYQNGTGFFGSYHGQEFFYELEHDSVEENAGQNCGNGSCGPGIYFFIDKPSVFKYWGKRNDGAGKGPIITSKLKGSRALHTRKS